MRAPSRFYSVETRTSAQRLASNSVDLRQHWRFLDALRDTDGGAGLSVTGARKHSRGLGLRAATRYRGRHLKPATLAEALHPSSPGNWLMTKEIRLNAFDMNCVGHIQHGMWTLARLALANKP
jgi:hypothetical protein